MKTIELGPRARLTVADVTVTARGDARLLLGEEGRLATQRARDVMMECVGRGELVYGVTTGFGPLATTHLSPELADQLQRNLLYHLATGVGPSLSVEQTRAMMVARASSLSRGYSAVRPEVIELLCACLERGVTPVVPSMGTVGASGDLTPLSHVALALLGEGWVHGAGGGEVWSREALEAAGLIPLELGAKEGLALVNGTATMTGVSALNGDSARRALDWALRLSAAFAEVARAKVESWDEVFDAARPHPGQRAARRRLGALLEGATRVRRRGVTWTRPEGGVALDQELVQERYSLRCVPQLLGAVHDALGWHDEVVERELESATDNPLVDVEGDRVLHGGNFFGQHVAFAADALNNAVVQIAVLAERQIAAVTDARTSGLPPFLTGGTPGLHSGLMGAQVTSSALIAELRARSVPASIQSVPTNGGNQDVVPMGTTAATRAAWSLERVWEVLAIGVIAAAQAMELEGVEGFGPHARGLHAFARERSAPLDVDRPLSREIMAVARALQSSRTT